MRARSWSFLVLFPLLVSHRAEAQTERFVFRPSDHLDRGVSFELDAPLAKIRARAPGLEGELLLEDQRAKGRFRVRVDRIETGNEGRDRDLRKPGWLDAKRWPHIGFVIPPFEVPAHLFDGRSHRLEVRGQLILHGVERSQVVMMNVHYDQVEAVLRCEGAFEVRLEDHRIQRSDSEAKRIIGLSVGEIATVRLELVGRRG